MDGCNETYLKWLDFSVKTSLGFLQRLASTIAEYIIYSTGCQLKLLAGFHGLLPGKLLRQGIKEFAFAVAGFKLGGICLFGQIIEH